MVSKDLFRELGHLKATEAWEMGVSLTPDSRARDTVFVTAVYTSSPEYNFVFLSYTPAERFPAPADTTALPRS